jgi:hypothetical protein
MNILFCSLLPLLIWSIELSAIPIPENLREAHIPVQRNPQNRPSHYPLISGDTFRACCDLVIDETSTDFDPKLVKKGSTIFVGMPYIKFFLDVISPEISEPFILVTSNGDGTIDDTFFPYLDNENLVKWFGRNIIATHPKLTCVPLGVSWFASEKNYQKLNTYFNKLTVNHFFKNKPTHTYLNMHNNHFSRGPILEYFSTLPFCRLAKRTIFSNYMNHLSSSRFVLSPRGFNIDCFRTWETLYAGSIPIVESHGIDSLYKDLPIIVVDNMLGITKEFLDQEFARLKQQEFHLEKLHAGYWINLIKEEQQKIITSPQNQSQF